MEPFHACAYWGPRKEDVASCALRSQKFLLALAAVSVDLEGWRFGGTSEEAARAEPLIVPSEEVLTNLLENGRNRTDIGNEVIEDLGYRISVWNGGTPEHAASLMIGCGSYSTVGRLGNAVVLGLPAAFKANSAGQLRKLMEAMVEPWEPDWAGVFSSEARRAHNEHSPFLHKALYLRAGMPLPVHLPSSGVETTDFAGGRLLLHGDEQ